MTSRPEEVLLEYIDLLPPPVKERWESLVAAKGVRLDSMIDAYEELGFASIPQPGGQSIVLRALRKAEILVAAKGGYTVKPEQVKHVRDVKVDY